MADICGYELPTNLQNFTQKLLTEVKIFQNVLAGYFFKTLCMCPTSGLASCRAVSSNVAGCGLGGVLVMTSGMMVKANIVDLLYLVKVLESRRPPAVM